MTVFARATRAILPTKSDTADGNGAESSTVKRPASWSVRNWPVRWKVVAIVVVPLVLAMVFGGFRIAGALTDAHDLRLAADRAEVVPAITKYMSALDVALLATSTGGDVEGVKKNYDARKHELQARLAETDVAADVGAGVSAMLNGGQALLDKVASNAIGLRERVTTYAPILLTAENAVDGSVRVDNVQIRAEAQGLSRAIGARGQMMMQQLLITRGADLPEPELRTSMITLAGTEPSTLFGMAEVLGVGSAEAKTLQQQMVTRMAIMSDPTSLLVNNPALLHSVQTTDAIAAQVTKDTTALVTKSVEDQAHNRRDAAIRDTVVVLAAIIAALAIVLLVARLLIQPLRVLRDSALKVAHEDLEREITRARAGDEQPPEPLPVHTTEEIGQVAHAVDELHTQALLLAGDEARLRLLVNDMFETMSRRNRSLVDQQLSLNLSHGKGLGIADMLVRQLGGHNGQGGESKTSAVDPGAAGLVDGWRQRLYQVADATRSAGRAAMAWLPADAEAFVRELAPQASIVAKELGLSLRTVLAQAALETQWGKHMPAHSDGSSSFNLFGIKAGNSWGGSRVNVPTVEYEGGIAVRKLLLQYKAASPTASVTPAEISALAELAVELANDLIPGISDLWNTITGTTTVTQAQVETSLSGLNADIATFGTAAGIVPAEGGPSRRWLGRHGPNGMLPASGSGGG